MTKREISTVLATASAEEVKNIAREIKKDCEIQIMKQPQKTLVMVKVREPVGKSLFYLGEVLATECMVTVDGQKGASVIAGDNFGKAMDAAVIDGYLNGEKDKTKIQTQIETLERKQQQEREKLNRQLRKSKVNFNVMGE